MMMNGVNTAAAQTVKTGSGGSQRGKSDRNVSFSSMMDASLSVRGNQSAEKKSSKEIAGAENSEPAEQPDRPEKAESLETTKALDTADKLQSQEDSKPVEENKELSAENETAVGESVNLQAAEVEEPSLEEQLSGLAEELLKKIMDMISDILSVKADELKKMMEQMGITMLDLLQPAVLQQLVVMANGGGDISALLTDETMASELTDILQQTDTILQEAGMTVEEITAQLSKDASAEVPVHLQPGQSAEVPAEMSGEELNAEFAAALQQAEKAVPENSEKNIALADSNEETAVKTTTESFHIEAVREISAGDSSTDSGGMMQDKEPDSAVQTVQAEQFMNLVSNAAAETDRVSFQELNPVQQIREIADQILEKIRIVVSQDTTSMEITLNPESLGRVSLSIISKEGAMTAQFTAQTQIAREAIESQMVVLRENLENQGLKVEAIEVNVSDFEFGQSSGTGSQEQQNNPGGRRRNINLGEESAYDTLTEAEAIYADLMQQSGNSVDFTA